MCHSLWNYADNIFANIFLVLFHVSFDASPHQLDQQSSARVSIPTINNVLLDNWLMTGQIKL